MSWRGKWSRERMEREKWEPGVRRDRLNPYRPPWHRTDGDTGVNALLCLSYEDFHMIAQVCAVTGWTGEDALDFLDLYDVRRKRLRAACSLLAMRVHDALAFQQEVVYLWTI